jgi:hypothetical protein
MRTLAHGLATAALLVIINVAPTPALAATMIGPHQHFVGLVNGSGRNPAVYTVCAGPVWNGRTGPVAGDQAMSVARVRHGGGFTGPFSHLYAWFVPTSTSSRPTLVRFTYYGKAVTVPTAIQVPCEGPGQVEFSPCPYLAPCAAGWTPYRLSIRFVDIAV